MNSTLFVAGNRHRFPDYGKVQRKVVNKVSFVNKSDFLTSPVFSPKAERRTINMTNSRVETATGSRCAITENPFRTS